MSDERERTAADLIAFEKDIAERFNRGEIRAPVHLDGGNEEQLIGIFRGVGPEDWVLGSWRQHYHCLLKGVPPERLKAEILAGRSIALCFPEYRVLSSAIVGGVLPLALGIAWEIKRRGGAEQVWAFMGDMTATTGMAHECLKYSKAWDLPIRWIVEVNGKSVCTTVNAVWNNYIEAIMVPPDTTRCYDYILPWPHSGAGVRVNF